MIWTRISLLLCVFGFLNNFQPSEPFAFEYLTGPLKNFTGKQIYQEVIPAATYSYLVTSLPALLLTDFLRYKPLIILCGLSGVCSRIALILSQSLWTVQIAYILTGLSYSTEVAYYTYLYAKVDKEHYQEVTSHTVTAVLLGRFVGSVTAQFLVSFRLLDYHQLNYLSLSSLIFGTIWAFFLPSVNQSIDTHPTTACNTGESEPPALIEIGIIESTRSTCQLTYSEPATDTKNPNTSLSLNVEIKNAFHKLWKDLLIAFSQRYVLIWSACWVFSYCGWLQVISYIQVLWQTSFAEADTVYNAGTVAVQTILSALATFGVGKLKVNWPAITEAFLAVFISIQGILLLAAAETHNIWLSYAAYAVFCIIFQIVFTVANSEIAKNVPENSYGLIIGLITFMGLVMQSVLTFTVTESWGLALSIRSQYLVYGSCFMIVGAIVTPMAIYTAVKQCRSDERFHVWE